MVRAEPSNVRVIGLTPGRHRRGIAVVYFLGMFTLLTGFCSLAVDFGRVLLVKEQLQCVADAAARAALYKLSTSVAAAQTAAVNVAAANTVDGSAVSITASTDVVFGTWDPVAQTFTTLTGSAQSAANAVQVTVHRTAARGNATRLTFAPLLGQSTCDVNSTATACKATTVALTNADFESPQLGVGNATYDCSMPGWTLTGSAALECTLSIWNAPACNGVQAIALQGKPSTALGTLSQTFTAVAGTYQVSFYAAQRTGYNNPTQGVQPIAISIDGAVITTMTPTTGSFAVYTTPTFALTTGVHVLGFAATENAVDLTTFVDTVSINVSNNPVLLAH
jgi:Flp pilus assembly protein TadG